MPAWLRIPQFIHAGLAVLFLAAGAGALFLLGQVQTLRCERAEGSVLVECRLVNTWMKRSVLEDRPLPPVRRALVERGCDEDGCTYRVLIETERITLPLSEIFTSDQSEQEGIARRINEYLQAPNDTPLEVETGGGLILIVPVMFLAGGAVLAFKAIRGLLLAKDDYE